MNKTFLIVAIFAFCLPLTVLSSDLKENDNRELASINLGTLLGGLLGNYNNTKPANTTNSTNNTSTTPSTNNTSGNNTSAPATNNTTSNNSSTPATNNTSTPVTNNTSSSNSSAPATNNTSSNNSTTTPVANTTQPSNPTNSTPVDDSDSDAEPEPTTPTNNTSSTNSTNTTSPTNSTNTTTPAAPIKYAKNDVNMANFKGDCLRVHNEQRLKVGLGNLTWSDSLASSAQAWANDMAKNGFRHSGKTGENIASTSYSTSTLGRLLGLWVHEQDHFIVGCKYPKCSTTSAEVGHYTQMVWHSTTQVGCGFAPGANRGYNYLCCQYYKAGNIVGQSVY